ncbi:serine hydrolase [Dactylosporangium sp. CA-139066]|uniref:serine hydrolase n=1 Tax=Dactylosporangium sp. CA-139066 TaxID=3239930 RepID=UPI003D8BF946
MRKRVGFTAFVLLVAALLVGVPFIWGSDLLDSYSDAASPASAAEDDESPAAPSEAPSRKAAPAAPTAPTLAPALLHPAPVTINATGFWSWTVLDRRTGAMAGSSNAGTAQRTASMIKAWLAADYLRRNASPSKSNLSQLTDMIRHSDNTAASYFWDLDGRSASITRLVQMCGLTDSKAYIDWASTLVSARDAARMGACIGDGRAAGPKWTDWLLNEMRNVESDQKFGIVPALPASEQASTAVKNGWINRSDGKWHVNCLAIGTDWVLGVLTVYPLSKGEEYGHDICEQVTKQLQA